MKKLLCVVMMSLIVLTLSGCDLSFFSTKSETSATTIAPSRTGSFEFENCSTFKDVYGEISDGGDAYMPSTGKVKVLIIPIFFTDVSWYKDSTDIENLNKTFFGKEEDTGWESVRSYFYESSYGALDYSGYITDWYTPSKPSSYYEQAYHTNVNVTTDLLIEAMTYFDPVINYNDYDSDKDGVIDAVYLLYNRPIEFSESGSIWWAWQAFYNDAKTFDNIDVYQYMWGGIDFMYYGNSDGKLLTSGLNASTFIHESTHLMGADDYYDYDSNTFSSSFGRTTYVSEKGEGCNLGIGNFDMMDANIGDHNPVTKMFLGWINPYVIVTGNQTVDLEPFSKTGDTVILCPSWNDTTNIKTEFFVIDFYDYAGLNAPGELNGTLFGGKGIRIYHVNASVVKDKDYWSIFRYDNSYTDHGFINLINAEGSIGLRKNDFIDSTFEASVNSLFAAGQTFVPNNHIEYSDKRLLKYSVTVDSITEEKATITIKIS